MEISVKLGGQLLLGTPRRRELALKYPIKVSDLALLLGLEPDEIGLIVIDRVQSELDDEISTDCTVSFFPYMSGG
jgi:molybdopterin converting factor small subunit